MTRNFADKNCADCGELFKPRGATHKFCGDCGYKAKRRAATKASAAYYQRHLELSRARARKYGKEHVTESNARQKVRRAKNPEFYLWQGAKGRARRNGIPFDITPEDIVIPEKCPVFGVLLESSGNGRRGGHAVNHSPSLDRIRPELGYVRGNIQVLSGRANTIKNSASPEELRLFALWVLGDASSALPAPIRVDSVMEDSGIVEGNEPVDAEIVSEGE